MEHKNQPAFNRMLVEMNIQKKNLNLEVFECGEYPNGYRWNEDMGGKWWRPAQQLAPVAVHNNWVKLKEVKIALFKRWGLWSLKDS